MEHKNFQYVCQVDTVYSLFLYLLLFPLNIDRTFFIFGCGIPDIVREQFVGNSFIIKKRRGGFFYSILNILRCWILLPYVYKKYKLKDKISYGQDHLIFSQYVIDKSLYFNLLEDGTANYIAIEKLLQYRKEHFLRWKVTSFLNQLRGVINMPWGFHPKIKEIYLSGILKIPSCHLRKIQLFSLNDKWANLSEWQKKAILQLLCAYDLLGKDVNYDILLLTQCFSEAGKLSENGKIQMYKDILSIYEKESLNICLKPHPRERTNYEKIFPSVKVIPPYIPFEILNVACRVNIQKAITISSTSIYCLKESIDKIILGSQYLNKYRYIS